MPRQVPRHRKHLITILLIVALVVLYRRRDGDRGGSLRDGPVDALNQTLGFERIFVINLPERTDRRDSMTLAAAVTGLNFTFVPGVRATDVPEKALPPGERDPRMKWDSIIGSWRAHMNVLHRIVHENLTSALILEDDADWDIRLKSQFQSFAVASQAYLQPLSRDPSRSLAESYPPVIHDDNRHLVNLLKSPSVLRPTVSPYGDEWDVLWLGHTGSELPAEWQNLDENQKYKPRSLLTIYRHDDETVAIPAHLKRHPYAGRIDQFAERFAPHTRIVHESRGTTGVQAYAVSQRGARKLLWQFGLDTFTTIWDGLLRDWCDGRYDSDSASPERPVCLTTQPPLIAQHFAKGGSDIQGIGGGYFRKTGSTYIRYSVKLNLQRLLYRKAKGLDEVEGLVDQWPDDTPGPW